MNLYGWNRAAARSGDTPRSFRIESQPEITGDFPPASPDEPCVQDLRVLQHAIRRLLAVGGKIPFYLQLTFESLDMNAHVLH